MIVPSIDIMGGEVVQLVGGDPTKVKVNAGDPKPLAEKFGIVGDIAVVDLDAAMGRGSNADLIKSLLKIAPCRVGGGIRDATKGIEWLNAGGTALYCC
jgi:phosphoribosylformimino-5-aminoimidazole carboxamide ribonucleotide (ProFAR) isomerase